MTDICVFDSKQAGIELPSWIVRHWISLALIPVGALLAWKLIARFNLVRDMPITSVSYVHVDVWFAGKSLLLLGDCRERYGDEYPRSINAIFS